MLCIRSLTASKVVGMNWIEIPAGKYSLVADDKKRSLCQLELNVRFVVSHQST
jgi:DNA polymerase delta subunit 1